MIVINAKFFVKPEVKAEFLAKVAALITATRKEDGCLAYNLFQSVEDDNAFVMVENWCDQQAVDGHNKSELLLDLFKNMPHYAAKQSIISVSQAISK